MYVDIKNFDDVDVNRLIKTDDYHHVRMFVKEDFIGLANIREIERIGKYNDYLMVNLKCQCALFCDKIELINLK